MDSDDPENSRLLKIKRTLIGSPLSYRDKGVFHQISLIAFFAWVGLGADGLSSTCYGPEEAFRALGNHPNLGIFVALATALTILVLSKSYAQIIELFPHGGGGYVVASKLLSPNAGMVAGCALLIDYVLTIAISIASGADAIFSFISPEYHLWKLPVAFVGILMLTLMNLRGVKESVVPLVPIFMIFVLTHGYALLHTLFAHGLEIHTVLGETAHDFAETKNELGLMGALLLILRAYGMGAGTYTGIEAVSNSMAILREPKVETAKTTMRYMAISLAVMASGLILAYLLFDVKPEEGKTLNAVLLEHVTANWSPKLGTVFVMTTMISAAAILFIAAQAGFLSGPRVLANMAVDRWVPTRFASLSDRLVTHNGILLMGGCALVTVLLTRGDVGFLVVLYSINVFITFGLSQLGIVRTAWPKRADPAWRNRLRTNGIALAMTTFILISMTVMKFHDGGWITIAVTGTLIVGVKAVRAYYNRTSVQLKRLDSLIEATTVSDREDEPAPPPPVCDPRAKTAVVLVGGFNGLGLHTLFAIIRLFGDTFRNFVFMQVGMIDAGNFKGADEMQHLEAHVKSQLDRYVKYVNRRGYYAETRFTLDIDALHAIDTMAPEIMEKFPKSVFFGGQLAFSDDTLYTRWLHNYLVLAVQGRLHNRGVPFIILPIRVQKSGE